MGLVLVLPGASLPPPRPLYHQYLQTVAGGADRRSGVRNPAVSRVIRLHCRHSRPLIPFQVEQPGFPQQNNIIWVGLNEGDLI
ncbi:hypothetical protein GN956_G3293 [Arapaima gigas]